MPIDKIIHKITIAMRNMKIVCLSIVLIDVIFGLNDAFEIFQSSEELNTAEYKFNKIIIMIVTVPIALTVLQFMVRNALMWCRFLWKMQHAFKINLFKHYSITFLAFSFTIMDPIILIIQSMTQFQHIWNDRNCSELNVTLMKTNMYSFSIGTTLFSIFILYIIHFVSIISQQVPDVTSSEKQETEYSISNSLNSLQFNTSLLNPKSLLNSKF